MALRIVENKEADKESEIIKLNKDKPEAKRKHKFNAAKWTHPNGHPRCIVCGQEERTGGMCNESQYTMTSVTYAANSASDEYQGDKLVDMPHIDPGVETEKECKMCKGQECNCNNNDCEVCHDHLAGMHSKIESLNSIINYLYEADGNMIIRDVENSYWEVTSFKDKAFKYLKDYNIEFKPGDLVYIIKRNAIRDAKKHKAIFDKNVLPGLVKDAELVASGDDYYHLRPKAGSKLKKSLQKFAGSDTGRTLLRSIGPLIGIPGVEILYGLAKNVFSKDK